MSDDSDDFTTFRRNVVELVRDVLFIVGSQTLFASVSSWWHDRQWSGGTFSTCNSVCVCVCVWCGVCVIMVQLYANICKPGTAWNVTEACLFIMYAVAPSLQL